MKVNDAQENQPSVGRRSLLRGGAVLAGAGLAGTALAQPASAGGPDPVLLGTDNAETASTQLTVNNTTGDPAVPALKLNNANGPSLSLQPLDGAWGGSLEIGQVANTIHGPLIGLQNPAASASPGAPVTSFLVTGIDLEVLPTPIAVPPTRLLDTRTVAGRQGLLTSSPNAFGPDFKLQKNAWVDILVAPAAEGFNLPSVFINLTAVDANGTGFLAVYPPGPYTGTSTLNVVKGQTVANGAFVALKEVKDAAHPDNSYYALRVLTTAECWVIVDVTGAVIQGVTTVQPAGRRAAASRPSIATKLLAMVGRRR